MTQAQGHGGHLVVDHPGEVEDAAFVLQGPQPTTSNRTTLKINHTEEMYTVCKAATNWLSLELRTWNIIGLLIEIVRDQHEFWVLDHNPN